MTIAEIEIARSKLREIKAEIIGQLREVEAELCEHDIALAALRTQARAQRVPHND